jgi:hypothetical protein
MASGATYTADLGIGAGSKKEVPSTQILTGEFRAELFGVAVGTYALDAVHSPDTVQIAAPNSWWSVSGGASPTTGYARATWVQIGKQVLVDVLIIVDKALASPGLAASEARIRPYISPTASSEPIKYLGGFPLPEATGTPGGAGLPLLSMTITNQADAPVWPRVIDTNIYAKVLQDGKLALVGLLDQAAAAPIPTAITIANLITAGAFATPGANTKIRIQGQYITTTVPGRR